MASITVSLLSARQVAITETRAVAVGVIAGVVVALWMIYLADRGPRRSDARRRWTQNRRDW